MVTKKITTGTSLVAYQKSNPSAGMVQVCMAATHGTFRVRRKSKVVGLLCLFFMCVTLYSCTKESVVQPEVADGPGTFLITQQALDAATFVTDARDTLFTGNPFGAREVEARPNFRAIFSSANKSQVQQPGHITVIRSFANVDGRRGTLLFADVMVKREAGFNAGGNNFEYMRIPYDSSVDYGLHPNGMLPEISNTSMRGVGTNILSINCVTCHVTTADFIFYDNF